MPPPPQLPPVPFHTQDTFFNCGAACLQMLRHWHARLLNDPALFRADQGGATRPGIFEEADALPNMAGTAPRSDVGAIGPFQMAGWLNKNWTTPGILPPPPPPDPRPPMPAGLPRLEIPAVTVVGLRRRNRLDEVELTRPLLSIRLWGVAEEIAATERARQHTPPEKVFAAVDWCLQQGLPCVPLVEEKMHWVVLLNRRVVGADTEMCLFFDPWLPSDTRAEPYDPRRNYAHQGEGICPCGAVNGVTLLRMSAARVGDSAMYIFTVWPFGSQDKDWSGLQAEIQAAAAQIDPEEDGARRADYAIVPAQALSSGVFAAYAAAQAASRQEAALKGGRRKGRATSSVLEQLEAAGLAGRKAAGTPWGGVPTGGKAKVFTVRNVGKPELTYTLHVWPAGKTTKNRLAAITSPDGWLVDAAILHRWPDLGGMEKVALKAVKDAGSIEVKKGEKVTPAVGTVSVEPDLVWHPCAETRSPYWPLAAVGFKDANSTPRRVFVSPFGRVIPRPTLG